jgi:hypothetical protein
LHFVNHDQFLEDFQVPKVQYYRFYNSNEETKLAPKCDLYELPPILNLLEENKCRQNCIPVQFSAFYNLTICQKVEDHFCIISKVEKYIANQLQVCRETVEIENYYKGRVCEIMSYKKYTAGINVWL